jgi:hypothetical protein
MTGAAHHGTESVVVATTCGRRCSPRWSNSLGPSNTSTPDLFHNSRWVAANVHGPTTFYWAPHTWGSDIGTERAPVATPKPGKTLYRVELTRDHGRWSATFIAEGPSAP